MGPIATVVYKRIATLIAEKRDQPYSRTLFWIRCKLSFSLLRSAITAVILIIRTIQLFQHLPFSRKMINYCISSIRTPMFEIIVPISEHLHPTELKQGSPNIYYSLGGARTRVTERLLHTTCVFKRTTTVTAELKQRFPNTYHPSNSLCGARTAVAKCVLAFDGLCGGLPGSAKTCNSFRQSLRRSNRGGEMFTSVRQA